MVLRHKTKTRVKARAQVGPTPHDIVPPKHQETRVYARPSRRHSVKNALKHRARRGTESATYYLMPTSPVVAGFGTLQVVVTGVPFHSLGQGRQKPNPEQSAQAGGGLRNSDFLFPHQYHIPVRGAFLPELLQHTERLHHLPGKNKTKMVSLPIDPGLLLVD